MRDEAPEQRDDEVLAPAGSVVPFDSDEHWRALLDPARAWLSATLHFDLEGQPVISLRAGRFYAGRNGIQPRTCR